MLVAVPVNQNITLFNYQIKSYTFCVKNKKTAGLFYLILLFYEFLIGITQLNITI